MQAKDEAILGVTWRYCIYLLIQAKATSFLAV